MKRTLVGTQAVILRYGENAPQQPAYLMELDTDDPLALHTFKIHAGNPSMINFTDVDCGLSTMTRFVAALLNGTGGKSPLMALGLKHGNACGASFDLVDKSKAITKMLGGNLKSIFGGTVITNFYIDVKEANLLQSYGTEKPRPLDVVVASGISDDAIKILQRKNDRCLILTNKHLGFLDKSSVDTSVQFRKVRGGWIQQPAPTFILDLSSDDVVKYHPCAFKGDATEKYDNDTLLAWSICATSNSNTITLVRDGMLIGNGVGQQDRVEAVELAIKRATDAGHDIHGAVAASDSFFPFPDAPTELIAAGVRRIFATSGSVNDKAIIELFIDEDCELIHIPDSIGRGFAKH